MNNADLFNMCSAESVNSPKLEKLNEKKKTGPIFEEVAEPRKAETSLE